jgi:hypothetical protein
MALGFVAILLAAPAPAVEGEAPIRGYPDVTAVAAPVGSAADEASEPVAPPPQPAVADEPTAVAKRRFEPGSGLTFTSTDGRFELTTKLRGQFRWTLDHEGASGSTLQSLQIRRARLQFTGHAFGEHNAFKVELGFSPRDLNLDVDGSRTTPLLDWYVDFTHLRDLSLRIGQFKVPYSRQRVVSSGDLQLVDRSIANNEFNLDRDIGLDLHSEDFLGLERLRYHVGAYLGEGRDQFELSTFEMMYIGRVEVLPMGMFEDYEEADLERGSKPRLSLGAAYAFLDGAQNNQGVLGSAPTDGGTTDYHNVTADLMFFVAGFSLFGDVYWRTGRREFGEATIVDALGRVAPAPREAARNGIGWSAQSGFLVPETPLEIAARYAMVVPLEQATSLPRRDEAGGGLSWYFAGHPLKLQLDYFAGWEDARTTEVDHAVRLQLQASL